VAFFVCKKVRQPFHTLFVFSQMDVSSLQYTSKRQSTNEEDSAWDQTSLSCKNWSHKTLASKTWNVKDLFLANAWIQNAFLGSPYISKCISSKYWSVSGRTPAVLHSASCEKG